MNLRRRNLPLCAHLISSPCIKRLFEEFLTKSAWSGRSSLRFPLFLRSDRKGKTDERACGAESHKLGLLRKTFRLFGNFKNLGYPTESMMIRIILCAGLAKGFGFPYGYGAEALKSAWTVAVCRCMVFPLHGEDGNRICPSGKPEDLPEDYKKRPKIFSAMNAHEMMWNQRFCTELIRHTHHKLIGKAGRKLCMLSAWRKDIGIIVKIGDGTDRAQNAVVIETLRQLDLLTEKEWRRWISL